MTSLAVCGWLVGCAAVAAATCLHLRLGRHAVLAAQACHEVRGALCAARLAAEALGAPALDLELRRAALALADLDLAAAGVRARSRPERVDVGDLLEAAADTWGGRVSLAGPPRVEVTADPARLAQALGNLIANACEHGGGRARLSARRLPGLVRVEVADEGPGLPAPVTDLVAAAGARRGARGHGLGVAARLAEECGGRLLSAPAPRGARLVLELPVAGDSARSAAPLEPRAPEGAA